MSSSAIDHEQTRKASFPLLMLSAAATLATLSVMFLDRTGFLSVPGFMVEQAIEIEVIHRILWLVRHHLTLVLAMIGGLTIAALAFPKLRSSRFLAVVLAVYSIAITGAVSFIGSTYR